jgi:hypothetical protein
VKKLLNTLIGVHKQGLPPGDFDPPCAWPALDLINAFCSLGRKAKPPENLHQATFFSARKKCASVSA